MIIKCRGWHSYYDFSDIPMSLAIKVQSFPDEEYGVIRDWAFCTNDKVEYGTGQQELLEKFKKLAQNYTYVNDKKKDIQIIWVPNLLMIKGFFEDQITDVFPKKARKPLYIQLFNTLEFRELSVWNKEVAKTPIAEWNSYIEVLYKVLFKHDKYFYITPNQIVRRRIEKACKGLKLAKEIFPQSFKEYKYMRHGLFGGYCWCADECNEPITEPMLALDLTSAYIFCLLCRKHVVSKYEKIPTSDWIKYINTETDYTTMGLYKITYECYDHTINCYKNTDDRHIGLGSNVTEQMVMNNHDLAIFQQLVTIKNIECLTLKRYKVGHLPKPLMDVLVDEFVAKSLLAEGTEERRIQKIKLNGIYGDTIRKILEDMFKEYRDNAVLAPQWGIWTTSYCKELVFELGKELDGWFYSDTDSIYCLDTVDNVKKLVAFNTKIRNEVEEFCKQFGYDFEKLKNLGSFKIEAQIVKFRALGTKEYMYTTSDGQFVVKAAGCDKENEELNENLYEADKIPIGSRVFWEIKNHSYYEYTLYNEDAELMMNFMMLLLNFLN